MNFPSRRTPLALSFYCGFVGVVLGVCHADAQEPALPPLRVDPALLGQPAPKPSAAPAAVVPAPAQVASETKRAEGGAQVRPVDSALVDTRPVDVAPAAQTKRPAEKASTGDASVSPRTTPRAAKAPAKASPQEIPSRAVAPSAAPNEVEPPPAPQPVTTTGVTVAPPQRSPQESTQRKAGGSSAATSTTTAPATVPATAGAAASGDGATEPAPAPSVDPGLVDPGPVAAGGGATRAASAAAAPMASAVPVAAAGAPSATAGKPAQKQVGTNGAASTEKSWFRRVWDPVAYAYEHGDWEFYLPFATYHSRGTYTQEQIDSYQERPPGFGIGKGYYNEKGNWEGVYAMGFQDSHFKPSYTVGYGWQAIWRPGADVRLGLGYVAGLMTRADVANYVPFPIVLPTASLAYKNFSVAATYVPPGADAGNVLFLWAKWELGKAGEAVGTPAQPAPVEPLAPAVASTSPSSGVPRVPYGPHVAVTPDRNGRAATADAAGGVTAVGNTVSGETGTGETAGGTGATADGAPGVGEADTGPSLALRSERVMHPMPKESDVPRPVFVSAQRMGGDVQREFNAEGDAELRKVGTVLSADRLTYWPIDDEVEAEGSVRLEQGDDVVAGPKMRLKIEDQVGYFEQPSYTIRRKSPAVLAAEAARTGGRAEQAQADDWLNSGFASPRALNIAVGQATLGDTTRMLSGLSDGRGEAERIDFEGENQYRLTHSSYTTCTPGNDDWYLKTEALKLDYDRERADGSDGTLYFMDTPIFYSPWISFSLNNARKSGFLAPSYGSSSNSGFEVGLPYYWNIAPNMDATIAPTVLTKRGVLLGAEVRYLNTLNGKPYESNVKVDVLPNDRMRDGDTRYLLAVQHNQTDVDGWTGTINYNKVSDDNYFTDLSRNISSTSQVNLLQQGTVSYGGGGWWSATANVQAYQTLQPDPNTYNTYPYQMLPQLTLSARQPDLYHTDSSFWGQYTNFTIKERVQNGTVYPDGQRTLLYPQVSVPYQAPGWYVTPKIGVNYANYALTGQQSGVPGSQSRTLPIASIDSGMTFERPSNWFGRDYTQTLEPRLYYLYVPYRDQSLIPVFDTGLADFNFAQIFSENQFSGWDRVSNANQLTAAVTSRLVEPDTGAEIGRAMFGQRYYFEQNQVLLPGQTPDTGKWEKSAWLAAFSGQVLPRVYVDTAIQYDGADREVDRYSLATRYQPEPGKVFNAEYRYNRSTTSPIDQVDFSGQWPIVPRLYGVGRVNYSFKDDASNAGSTSQGGRLIQAVGGLEYNGGCWVLRGVLQRIATTQDTASTGFYLQLELSDFSRIGSNPLNILKGNIQGYSLINQPTVVYGQ